MIRKLLVMCISISRFRAQASEVNLSTEIVLPIIAIELTLNNVLRRMTRRERRTNRDLATIRLVPKPSYMLYWSRNYVFKAITEQLFYFPLTLN